MRRTTVSIIPTAGYLPYVKIPGYKHRAALPLQVARGWCFMTVVVAGYFIEQAARVVH